MVQSLLETYGIPSTLSYDVPSLVYPNNVGEIRVSVPPALEEQAMRILAEQRERIAPLMAAALMSTPAFPTNGNGHAPAAPLVFPIPLPLTASPFNTDEEEEDDDEDDEDWDDEDDDGGDEDEEGTASMDDEDLGKEEDDDDDDDDDDLFDDEE